MSPLKKNQIEDAPEVMTESAKPSTGASQGAYYTKQVGGITEAFYVDSDGTEIQLTSNGQALGSGGGGGNPLEAKDEGSSVDTDVKEMDFVGAGVTATQTASGIVEINIPGGSGLSLGETDSTAYRGDRGKIAYDHSQVSHAPSDAQKNSDIIKSEIEAVLTGIISSHSHAASGGDLVSTNNLSDVANAATSLSNLSGLDKTDIVSQVEAEAGTATTARAWTAQRVSQAIAALAGSGGGDLLAANNLSDVANAAASLGNLNGVSVTTFNSHTTPHAPDNAEQNATQISSGEKTAGTETALRSFSPKDVADMAGTHGGGGGSSVDEFRFTLPAAASLAARIAASTNLPAGWTIQDASAAGEAQFGSDADTLVMEWDGGLGTKIAQEITVFMKTTGGPSAVQGVQKFDLTAAGKQKTNTAETKAAVYTAGIGVDALKDLYVFIKLI